MDPHGYDAGKKVRGKKRHVLVDTQGLLMVAAVHGAEVQDRDGGVLLMAALFGLHPFLVKLYADSGYAGPKFKAGLARACRQVDVEVVKRSEAAKFVVLPKRWIVERTIAWLNRVAQPVPQARQGLGAHEPQRPCVPAMGVSPAHGAKALPAQRMISDRHLDVNSAINFIKQFNAEKPTAEFQKYEIVVNFSNGDKIDGLFSQKEKVLSFIKYITS